MQIDIQKWEGKYILLSPDIYRLSVFIINMLDNKQLLFEVVKKYNGTLIRLGNVICFNTRDDAQQMKDWIDSLIVLSLLRGKEIYY